MDQHVQKSPESIALIWERDEPGTEVRITYRYCVSPDGRHLSASEGLLGLCVSAVDAGITPLLRTVFQDQDCPTWKRPGFPIHLAIFGVLRFP